MMLTFILMSFDVYYGIFKQVSPLFKECYRAHPGHIHILHLFPTIINARFISIQKITISLYFPKIHSNQNNHCHADFGLYQNLPCLFMVAVKNL